MKRSYLVLVLIGLLCILSGFSVTRGQNNAKIFSPKDCKVLNIQLDMEKSQVEKVLGKPKKIESHREEAFGANVLTYYYKFGTVRFEPEDASKYTVSEIKIDKPNFKGPRNIKINDNTESVLNKFPHNKDAIIDKSGKKYIYGNSGENCGWIEYKNGGITFLTYGYGGGGFGTYVLRMKVENNKIKSIAVVVMNV
jgi:hypothetical protein